MPSQAQGKFVWAQPGALGVVVGANIDPLPSRRVRHIAARSDCGAYF